MVNTTPNRNVQKPAKEGAAVSIQEDRYSTRPVEAEVRDGMLWITLAGGRIIAVPVEWFPTLSTATPQQQAAFELSDVGLHWPEIDEDISIRGILRGCDGYVEPFAAVMTVQEVADEFSISRFTVHDAIRNDWLPAHRSGKTYLIRRRDAEARWGGKQK